MFHNDPQDVQTEQRLPHPVLGERLYIVGDVHGRDDLVERLLLKIDEDLTAHPLDAPVRLVFVGDYVDRGEQSRQVIERCYDLVSDPTLNVTCIKGNHEELLLNFIKAPSENFAWLDHGGLETLASYGVAKPLRRRGQRDFVGLATEFAERLGAHRGFLEAMPLSLHSGNIFVSHAGLDPAAPLSAQRKESLIWGHPEFLRYGPPENVVAVHGHWASETLDLGVNRIGVDTGAYLSGRLTALGVDQTHGYWSITT